MSPRSLTSQDREAAWRLLLGAYSTSGSLSDNGLRLCRRRFFDQGDRDLTLVTVLGRALVARKVYDEETAAVLEVIAERDTDEGRSARRVVVRCDANLGRFRRQRLDWYREALASGSLTAGFVLARGALDGELDDEPELAVAGVTRCLAEGSPRQWEQADLDRPSAVAWLAEQYLPRPPSEVGVAAVEAAIDLQPEHLPAIRWLVAAYRPGLGARAVERYLTLFRLDPDDADNTTFLATALIERRLRVDPSCEILTCYLRLGASDPVAARRTLAEEAVRLQRDDAEAQRWLRQALAEGDPSRELVGWLAVCEARGGPLDEAAQTRCRDVVLDAEMPRAWRAELALLLARRLQATGGRDDEVLRVAWQTVEPARRPDWLAVRLAPSLVEVGRTDAETVPIYRAAYRVEPSPELARLLAAAYLTDRDTPLREKIDHWRACLARGEAEPDVLVALAQALANEGAATEAALAVVDDMPEAQRPRVLDELCRHRFRQGEYASAETIASRLLRLRPGDPDVVYRLYVCRLRRALRDGQALPPVPDDLGGERLVNLRRLVAAAHGEPVDDRELADAIVSTGVHSPALHVAVGALFGHEQKAPPVETGIPRNTWLLATVEQAQGQTARARRRLQASEDPDLRLWERYLAARQALDEGRGAAACELLLPVLHRAGPPWDGPRELLASLAPRHAPAELLGRLAPLLGEAELRVARVRAAVQRAAAGERGALEEIQALAGEAAEPELRELPLALLAEQAAAAYGTGDTERFRGLLADLAATGDTGDRVRWLRALSARLDGDHAAAYEEVFALSDTARAMPGLAAEVATWYLGDGALSRAEAVLSHALRHHRGACDLLCAVAWLNAQLGRADKFLSLVPIILRELPAGDPRADTLNLLRDVLERPLSELDAESLTESIDSLPLPAALLRGQLLFGHLADRLRRGQRARLSDEALGRLGARAERDVDLRPVVDELKATTAYSHLAFGETDAAESLLATIDDPLGSALHNRAVVAEAAIERGLPNTPALRAAAAAWREEATVAWARAPFEDVAADYRQAVMFASYRHIAGHYRQLERWADELRCLERCIEYRPYDIAIQRASLQPLLTLGEGEKALHKSQWLLTQQPDDLEVQLDHATVLASTRGVAEATAWLERVKERRPEAAETVRQRREELRDKLVETAQRRAEAGDYVGMFAISRDLEGLADSESQRARALLQQAYALAQMGGDEDQVPPLEQALARCEEVLALGGSDRGRQRAEALREQVRARLAPQLARQAEELFLHRRREFQTLAEQRLAPPPEAGTLARGLALAFERVADLYRRAADLGDAALGRQVATRVQEAEELQRRCRELESGLRADR